MARAELQTYALVVERTVSIQTTLYVDGDSLEDAKTRFQHQLESEACSQIAEEDWVRLFKKQYAKADPYDSEYSVVSGEIA